MRRHERDNRVFLFSAAGSTLYVTSRLPKMDYGIEGLIVHADKGESGDTYFVYAEREIPFPEDAHGEQWTVMIQGRCDFTAGGKTCAYEKGDTYRIPAGIPHQITLHPGYAEMDYTLHEKKKSEDQA